MPRVMKCKPAQFVQQTNDCCNTSGVPIFALVFYCLKAVMCNYSAISFWLRQEWHSLLVCPNHKSFRSVFVSQRWESGWRNQLEEVLGIEIDYELLKQSNSLLRMNYYKLAKLKLHTRNINCNDERFYSGGGSSVPSGSAGGSGAGAGLGAGAGFGFSLGFSLGLSSGTKAALS